MHNPNPKVDFYFQKSLRWHAELLQLRTILLDGPLVEDLKWGTPCYTLGGKNIVLIHEFKDYCAVLFFKGALLQDDHGLLVQQTDNTQASRQMRFISVDDVASQEFALRAYVQQAITIEEAGLKVAFKKPSEMPLAEEFKQALDQDPALKAAFEALTPGRQRAYHLYFTAAKQAKTRLARVEKCVPVILAGKWIED
jgi:uncharacterized protein YdeI (YjbR/CyaY-like superfamily)